MKSRHTLLKVGISGQRVVFYKHSIDLTKIPASTEWKFLNRMLSNRMLLLLGSSSASDNLDKFASNDGLASAVEENLELVDHVAGVLGSVLQWNQPCDASYSVIQDYSRPWRCGEQTARKRDPRQEPNSSQLHVNFPVQSYMHTQKRELAREYSRRLGRDSSLTSNKEKLATIRQCLSSRM